MNEDTEWPDESTPRGRHVKSSDDQLTQDEPGTLHVADDMSPVTKSRDSPVDLADSSSTSERYHFCPSCGAEAKPGISNCEKCWRPLPVGSGPVTPSGTQDRRYCPSCGVEVKPGVSTCQGCWQPLPLGADLSTPPVTGPPEVSPPIPKDLQTAANQPRHTASPDEQRLSDPDLVFTPPVPTANRTATGEQLPARESAAPVKRKRGKKRILVAVVLVLILGGVIAALSHSHSSERNGSTGNDGTTQATAPSGSTKSYTDGYLFALSECLAQTNGKPVTNLAQGCELIPYELPGGFNAPPSEWCINQTRIEASLGQQVPPLGDSSQWYTGCEAVASQASW